MFLQIFMFRNKLGKFLITLLLLSIIFLSTTSISALSTKEAVVLSPSDLSATPAAAVSPVPAVNPIFDYSLNIDAQSAVVFESGRGMRLYLKNPDLKVKIPVASKIMAAIIALETIPIDTKITISKVAAGELDANVLSLKNGEKYSLEYLLYGMLLKDNNAAAIAISEQISGLEEEFVKLMNSKAISYQMNNTMFTNVTGALSDNQYTTASDVARLVRFALTISKFETIFKTKDIPFFLSTDQTKHLVNNLERAWSLVDTTTGALQSSSGNQSSYVVTASSNEMNIITIASTTNKNKIIDDITTISNSIFSDYESSSLVIENQPFPKSLVIGTDIIALKFIQTINYVHPRNVEFVNTTIYEENLNIEYPILATKSVAKVTFELKDGTKITAALYPDKNVWGESSNFQKIQSIYNSNRDIGMIVIIALACLLLLCIYRLILLIIKLVIYIFKGSKNNNAKKLSKSTVIKNKPMKTPPEELLNPLDDNHPSDDTDKSILNDNHSK